MEAQGTPVCPGSWWEPVAPQCELASPRVPMQAQEGASPRIPESSCGHCGPFGCERRGPHTWLGGSGSQARGGPDAWAPVPALGLLGL